MSYLVKILLLLFADIVIVKATLPTINDLEAVADPFELLLEEAGSIEEITHRAVGWESAVALTRKGELLIVDKGRVQSFSISQFGRVSSGSNGELSFIGRDDEKSFFTFTPEQLPSEPLTDVLNEIRHKQRARNRSTQSGGFRPRNEEGSSIPAAEESSSSRANREAALLHAMQRCFDEKCSSSILLSNSSYVFVKGENFVVQYGSILCQASVFCLNESLTDEASSFWSIHSSFRAISSRKDTVLMMTSTDVIVVQDNTLSSAAIETPVKVGGGAGGSLCLQLGAVKTSLETSGPAIHVSLLKIPMSGFEHSVLDSLFSILKEREKKQATTEDTVHSYDRNNDTDSPEQRVGIDFSSCKSFWRAEDDTSDETADGDDEPLTMDSEATIPTAQLLREEMDRQLGSVKDTLSLKHGAFSSICQSNAVFQNQMVHYLKSSKAILIAHIRKFDRNSAEDPFTSPMRSASESEDSIPAFRWTILRFDDISQVIFELPHECHDRITIEGEETAREVVQEQKENERRQNTETDSGVIPFEQTDSDSGAMHAMLRGRAKVDVEEFPCHCFPALRSLMGKRIGYHKLVVEAVDSRQGSVSSRAIQDNDMTKKQHRLDTNTPPNSWRKTPFPLAQAKAKSKEMQSRCSTNSATDNNMAVVTPMQALVMCKQEVLLVAGPTQEAVIDMAPLRRGRGGIFSCSVAFSVETLNDTTSLPALPTSFRSTISWRPSEKDICFVLPSGQVVPVWMDLSSPEEHHRVLSWVRPFFHDAASARKRDDAKSTKGSRSRREEHASTLVDAKDIASTLEFSLPSSLAVLPWRLFDFTAASRWPYYPCRNGNIATNCQPLIGETIIGIESAASILVVCQELSSTGHGRCIVDELSEAIFGKASPLRWGCIESPILALRPLRSSSDGDLLEITSERKDFYFVDENAQRSCVRVPACPKEEHSGKTLKHEDELELPLLSISSSHVQREETQTFFAALQSSRGRALQLRSAAARSKKQRMLFYISRRIEACKRLLKALEEREVELARRRKEDARLSLQQCQDARIQALLAKATTDAPFAITIHGDCISVAATKDHVGVARTSAIEDCSNANAIQTAMKEFRTLRNVRTSADGAPILVFSDEDIELTGIDPSAMGQIFSLMT